MTCNVVKENMIHQWILNNGICLTFHSRNKWLQIDTSEKSGIKQLPSVRIKDVTNSIDVSKKNGDYYWNDYAKSYTEGNFESKGQPFSFYMQRNEQFQKVYENTEHIEYLKDVGFDKVFLQDRRYRDRMPRITWCNFTNTRHIKSYERLKNTSEVDSRYIASTTIFERYPTLGCCLTPLLIIGAIILFIIVISSL